MSQLYRKTRSAYRILRRSFRNSSNRLFGNKNYKKFIIITYARTGSNLLMSYMDSHKNVEAKGELFRNLEGKTTKQVWNGFFNYKNRKISNAGFKLFYTHPFHTDDRSVWEIIENDRDIRIIHLVRKNKLRTYISGEIAKKTDKWTRKKNSKISTNDKRLEIDFSDFETRVSKIDQFEKEARERFKNHDFLEVCYEDLVSEKDNTMNAIFDFLSVERSLSKTSYKKQNSESLKDLVINFDDFVSNLSKSEFSYLLEFESLSQVPKQSS